MEIRQKVEKKPIKGGSDSDANGSVAGRSCSPATRGGRQAAGKWQQSRDRESLLRSNQNCGESKNRSSEKAATARCPVE